MDAVTVEIGRNKATRFGAGPGAADLITVRGARALAQANVVLHDALTDPALRASWERDVAAMRERILAMRRALHGVLAARLPGRPLGYLLSQRGMFSYTGLSAAQVDRLRDEFAGLSRIACYKDYTAAKFQRIAHIY